MAITLSAGDLRSRQERNRIGTRKIGKALVTKKDEKGGILGFLFDAGKALVSFLFNAVRSVFSFSLTAIVGLVVGTVQFIWNFNWNATDEEMNSQIRAQWSGLANRLGGILGYSVGSIVCGALGSIPLLALDERALIEALKNTTEEIKEEILEGVSQLLKQTAQVAVNTLISKAFQSARSWIKKSINNPVIAKVSKLILGKDYDKKVKEWGKSGEPWSFAQKFEDWIDRIENPILKNFTEEFFEEAFEGCQESLYVLASSFDSAKQKQQAELTLGKYQGVVITPDRDRDEEKIILTGREEVLKPAITAAIANYQLVSNRDIGQTFSGLPEREYIRAKPSELSLKILLSSHPPGKPKPTDKSKVQTATYSISDLDKSKISFQSIKDACGGADGYLWGRYLAHADLDNGRKQMCYGGSEIEAEQMLRRLLSLSTAKILTLNVSEEKKEGQRAADKRLFKESVKLYPLRATIVNAQKLLTELNKGGKASLAGTYKTRKHTIELWRARPFPGVDELIKEMLSRSS